MAKRSYLLLITLFFFFFSLFIGVDRFIHRKPVHFSSSKIAVSHKVFDEWDSPMPTPEEKNILDKILNQNFSYFTKSDDTYLFLSDDHQFIIKFLKQHPYRPKSWLAYIPLSFNPYYREYCEKLKIRKKIFNACKTAFLELKEETGIVYVHINPTHFLNKKITVCDRNGKNHTIDLDRTSFYIQRRAQLIYPRISDLMRAGDSERCKNILASVIRLIAKLGKKGVCNKDLSLYKNFGVINDKAVQLTITKFQIDQTAACQQSNQNQIMPVIETFRRWVQKNYPELLAYFDEKLSELD